MRQIVALSSVFGLVIQPSRLEAFKRIIHCVGRSAAKFFHCTVVQRRDIASATRFVAFDIQPNIPLFLSSWLSDSAATTTSSSLLGLNTTSHVVPT
jgi:hypothetical protein